MKIQLIICLLLGAFVKPLHAHADANFDVAILVFDKVQIIDFAAPYEVFGHAGFNVVTVSPDGKGVITEMGLQVIPDHSFASLPEVDAIIVPGGDVGDIKRNQAVLSWLNASSKNVAHIMSVCTGSHILAESGLLNGQAATTFHRAIQGFEQDYPEIQIQRDKRFVDNGQIVTSAGLSSGIDASLHLVAKVLGEDTAKTIALHLEYEWQSEGGFVRAMMADRMLPDNELTWPEDAKFSRLSNYGGSDYWQTTYKATSSAGLEALVKIYQNAMKAQRDWSANDDSSSDSMSWSGQHQANGWQHTLHYSEMPEDNAFKLQVTVTKTHG